MPEKDLKKNQELLPTEERTSKSRISLVLSIRNPDTKNVNKIENHKREKFKGSGYKISIIKIGSLCKVETMKKTKLGKEYTELINQEWKGKRESFNNKLRVKRKGIEKI